VHRVTKPTPSGAELRWLGIQHSPSFVGELQCDGRDRGFSERFNQEWLVQRHDYCMLRAIRAKMQRAA
jgi:hypothetical protein